MKSVLDEQVRRCLGGDLACFEDIVKTCEADVRAVLAAMTPDPNAVPDLAQEVFVVVYRKLDAYQPGTNFKAWVKAIARNTAQNERRRWYRHQAMQEQYQAEAEAEHKIAENIDQFVESLPEETLASLRDCVGGLQGKTRALVDGYYFKDCSLKEVAELLKMKTTAAKVALHRARAAVGKCLEGKGR